MGYTKQRAGITKRLESAKNRDLASGFLPVKQHTCRIVGHPIELIKVLMDLCWLLRIYLCSGAALAEIAQLLIWRLSQSAGFRTDKRRSILRILRFLLPSMELTDFR